MSNFEHEGTDREITSISCVYFMYFQLKAHSKNNPLLRLRSHAARIQHSIVKHAANITVRTPNDYGTISL